MYVSRVTKLRRGRAPFETKIDLTPGLMLQITLLCYHYYLHFFPSEFINERSVRLLNRMC